VPITNNNKAHPNLGELKFCLISILLIGQPDKITFHITGHRGSGVPAIEGNELNVFVRHYIQFSQFHFL